MGPTPGRTSSMNLVMSQHGVRPYYHIAGPFLGDQSEDGVQQQRIAAAVDGVHAQVSSALTAESETLERLHTAIFEVEPSRTDLLSKPSVKLPYVSTAANSKHLSEQAVQTEVHMQHAAKVDHRYAASSCTQYAAYDNPFNADEQHFSLPHIIQPAPVWPLRPHIQAGLSLQPSSSPLVYYTKPSSLPLVALRETDREKNCEAEHHFYHSGQNRRSLRHEHRLLKPDIYASHRLPYISNPLNDKLRQRPLRVRAVLEYGYVVQERIADRLPVFIHDELLREYGHMERMEVIITSQHGDFQIYSVPKSQSELNGYTKDKSNGSGAEMFGSSNEAEGNDDG